MVHKSQSFIHQGFSSDSPSRAGCSRMSISRNPLFIKEFFLTKLPPVWVTTRIFSQSQSFIHQGFSSDLRPPSSCWAWRCHERRNPLFIKAFLLSTAVFTFTNTAASTWSSQSFIHQGFSSDPAPLQHKGYKGLPDHFLYRPFVRILCLLAHREFSVVKEHITQYS